MKRILPVIVIALGSLVIGAQAQNIILKDGKSIAASKMRRDGTKIMTTVTIGNGLGEVGYDVAQIAAIEFPDPPQLKEAAALIAAGKAEQALEVIDPVLNDHRHFKDIKGNYWGNAAILKLIICAALHREKDSESLIPEMLSTRDNAEVIATAKAGQSLVLARNGKAKEAVLASNEIINQEGVDSTTLSIAYLANGEGHLELKEYEDAAFAFLHVPIFFSDQKLLMPAALMGSARSFAKLNAKNELGSAIKTLTQSYPNSSEAITAQLEFPNVLSRIQKANNNENSTH